MLWASFKLRCRKALGDSLTDTQGSRSNSFPETAVGFRRGNRTLARQSCGWRVFLTADIAARRKLTRSWRARWRCWTRRSRQRSVTWTPRWTGSRPMCLRACSLRASSSEQPLCACWGLLSCWEGSGTARAAAPTPLRAIGVAVLASACCSCFSIWEHPGSSQQRQCCLTPAANLVRTHLHPEAMCLPLCGGPL